MTRILLLIALTALFLPGCDDDDTITTLPIVEVPTTYTFERNGSTTVYFTGQTTRIAMATELTSAMTDPERTLETLAAMFNNQGPNGEDVTPFTSAALNESDKSIRNRVAASTDYFSTNATDQAAIRGDFDGWLSAQVNEVFPRWNELAAPGQAGQIADGSRARYVNSRGLEYNQVFAKSLLGALMLDQTLNNYLSPAVLDEAQNRNDNDDATLESGQPYTTMEHKWDEAYGYVFGASQDPANPLATLGQDDKFLNEYLAKVDEDEDFRGIAQTVFDAFKTGRAAIVAGDYAERDRQAAIIQRNLSRVVAVRGAYYLAQGSNAIDNNANRSASFHALSEAYGFVYSLQFTSNPATGSPYFDRTEVRTLLDSLTASSDNGLWDVQSSSIRSVANDIADRLDFTYDTAAN